MFKSFMYNALEQAQIAFSQDEVPVGAVLVDYYNNKILFFSHNSCEQNTNILQHAEINLIQEASLSFKSKFLSNCDIYVTLEPCPMCASALAQARIRRIYFGAYDLKSGGTVNGPAVIKFSHYKPEIYGGIMEEECSNLIKAFFEKKRY